MKRNRKNQRKSTRNIYRYTDTKVNTQINPIKIQNQKTFLCKQKTENV